MARTARLLLVSALAIAAAYYFRVPLATLASQAYRTVSPCTVPVRYTLGGIDERFRLSEEEALSALRDAETIWEEDERTLFVYDPEHATLRVHFVYDERQERTNILEELDIEIDSTLESYENVQVRYESAEAAYEAKKRTFESERAVYENRVAAYEADVESWNESGGAPESAYTELDRERRALEREAARISALADGVNASAREANAIGEALNSLARDVNVRASTYNAEIGEEEFEEAVYESTPGRETITVFEFGDHIELVRVLGHEFGHSLGLDHVADTEAIMYELNLGSSTVATDADKAALWAACRTQS
jgi:chromosome segregation ATPase